MRWLWLAVLALLPVCTGCGGVGVSGAETSLGNQLTIYSSLPLQGPSGAVSEQIVGGEKLALSDAGGHIGALRISYVSLDDSNPTTGQWDPGATASDAKTAVQDPSTIAYLGDYNSAATAVSLPLINAAGILQISPASPYVGLTSSLDAGQDEPERFYPTGKRTFARLTPGDSVVALAEVKLMRSLRVKRLYVLNDQNPFQVPLAQIVAADAERAGIKVKGNEGVDTTSSNTFTGEVEKIVASGAQAVFFSGDGTQGGTVRLWRQLHGAAPQLLLLAPSTMLDATFTTRIGGASRRTFLTTPVLASGSYPPSAQRVLRDYRRRFASAPGPYVLYGYEAMSVALAAIRGAGSHGDNRQAVINRFFATHNRDSVLGRYSIQSDGDTTLARYGVDRIVRGLPVFDREILAR